MISKILSVLVLFFLFGCSARISEKMYISGIDSSYYAGDVFYFHVWKKDIKRQIFDLGFDSFYVEFKDPDNLIIDSFSEKKHSKYYELQNDLSGGNYHFCVYEFKKGKKRLTTYCDTVIYIESVPEDERAYKIVEKMPEFPGGEIALRKFLAQNFHYPVCYHEITNIRIYLRFIIDENGNVQKPRIIRGICEHTDQEAIRVIQNMPMWKPGEHQGEKVKVWYTVPIHIDIE